jgi:polyhydroxyalkanoate synthesis repressor PhaR
MEPPNEQTESSGPVHIRKYPNRRYYDSTRSRHVTLEEIYELIRKGHEIQVTDSKTDQDITAKVLAQIIIELDPPKLDVFPVALLHRLLRSNSQIVTEFVNRYFNVPLATFLDSQRSFEQYFRSAMGLPAGSPTTADFTKMMWNTLRSPLGAAASDGNKSAPVSAPQPPPPFSSADSDGENARLRNMVEQLRREVHSLRGDSSASKKKRARNNPSGPRKRAK